MTTTTPRSEMDFDAYSTAAKSTGRYPEVGTGSLLALSYLGLGLGEVGEVQGKLKKVLRDDGGILSDDKRVAILVELGDALWYVDRLADELGSSLREVAEWNVAKLAGRKERGTIGGSGDVR